MNYLIGIDEAGWGPVLGPLVLAGVVVEELALPLLEKYGVKDSKLFGSGKQAREKRKELWERISPHLTGFSVKIISAEELDNGNTIDLEIKNIVRILNELNVVSPARQMAGGRFTCPDFIGGGTNYKIIIGLLGKLSKKKFINALFNLGCRIPPKKLIYEEKADRKYLPVSAASILAKITRDQEVEKICQEIGEEYVSGYPNPNTATFLKKYCGKYHRLPPQVRKTRKWFPLQRIIKKIQNSKFKI